VTVFKERSSPWRQVWYREQEDVEAAHKLITSNLRFVVKVSLEYRGYGIKLLDMIQEGNMGLMVA
jgi:RNA polymerase sigma-32 factor